ncbi:MAG TPA: insulinase family protein [Cycloclasticus sp.]|nr:insulinase family protein [Cycloclasticus sp.]
MYVNRRYVIGFVLALVSTISAALPNIQHWETKNGAKVFFVPTKGLPILDVQLVFDAGSARDGSKKGLAALTSTMLNEGAGGLMAQAIAEELESVGAQLGASSSRDFTTIKYRSLTDKTALTTSWAVLKKVLNQPEFPLLDFKREKERTLLGIKRREESPGTLAQLALYKAMYKDHPYANAIAGEVDSVTNINVEDLISFYKTHYVAKNLIVVLVGGISRDQAEQLVGDLVNDLPEGEKTSKIQTVKDVKQGAEIHREYSSQQTHLMYSLPVLTHNDADYFALYVGNHILGGSGFSSRIVKDIREERGLAYSAYSYFHPMIEKGPFLMGLQTRNEKVAEASTAVKAVLKEFIDNGPSEEELIAAKKNISGGFALKLDSNKKLLGNVVSIVASGAPLGYLDHYLQNVKSITREQIQDAFKRRVDMNKMTLVTVGQTVAEQQ